MAILGKEKYSPERLEKLHQYIEKYAERGQPVEYEILVDKFKAVRRTDDPTMFNMYEDFVGAETKSIEVLLYAGTSNNNDKYIFTFQEESKESELSGIEIENRIQEHVHKAKQEWDFEQLKKDNAEWEKYAKELEEEVDKLEKQLDEVKSGQSPLHGFLGEFGSSFVSGLVKQNPKIIKNIPALSGLVDKEDTKEETEVTFKSSNSEQAENPETKEAVSFVNYLKGKLSQEQFGKVMLMLDILTEKPEKIEEVMNYLNGGSDGSV